MSESDVSDANFAFDNNSHNFVTKPRFSHPIPYERTNKQQVMNMNLCAMGIHSWKTLLRNYWRNPWGEAWDVGKCCARCRKKVYNKYAK